MFEASGALPYSALRKLAQVSCASAACASSGRAMHARPLGEHSERLPARASATDRAVPGAGHDVRDYAERTLRGAGRVAGAMAIDAISGSASNLNTATASCNCVACSSMERATAVGLTLMRTSITVLERCTGGATSASAGGRRGDP
ncbi:hypothetical protein [Xanthomonas rydalmerensis]|uniref:Uncharacterized protein n=1 Tax=Xanthomonas rydalmerensis TaxID=3046274 RepID=A0ABZ0JIY0_9XANT|nr:hypothetical protein [Xanthomonas sp. DM-2023]WOS38985.1 hypothetical protein QN243_10990 [Xanthomonas sp. DM-2023]WOS43167.1 hypothetical protein QN242_10990 [Xanthomonas sp. DM-2023]WOS47347.1 hypothetical protein QN240_10990 [Xanthomonas sp. DM-2023]WOS51528.1 hypothetical protein QN244_10990 [Xanthomonas sp. DM-2023]WOS55710.1 hypothetical protein QN245_10990 [Xanthomonas sp. DM-2023]